MIIRYFIKRSILDMSYEKDIVYDYRLIKQEVKGPYNYSRSNSEHYYGLTLPTLPTWIGLVIL